jgi:hypothetical protein
MTQIMNAANDNFPIYLKAAISSARLFPSASESFWNWPGVTALAAGQDVPSSLMRKIATAFMRFCHAHQTRQAPRFGQLVHARHRPQNTH